MSVRYVHIGGGRLADAWSLRSVGMIEERFADLVARLPEALPALSAAAEALEARGGPEGGRAAAAIRFLLDGPPSAR